MPFHGFKWGFWVRVTILLQHDISPSAEEIFSWPYAEWWWFLVGPTPSSGFATGGGWV